jgi:hypothetical protein
MKAMTLILAILITISTTITLPALSSFAQSESIINVIQQGLKPNDPNYDNAPWFNKLVANIGTVQTIYFPSGIYYFNSRPNVITKPLVIRGDGVSSTNLIRNFNGRNHDEALIHTQRTIYIEKLAISARAGTSHGGAIRLDGRLASESVLRDLYITGQSGGTFDIPLTLYSNDKLGIRGCLIDNVELFAATVHIAWFVNVRGLTAKLNAYPAGGTVDHVTIQGINSDLRSAAIQFETRHLVRLYVYKSNDITLRTLGTQLIVDKDSINIRKL